MASMSVATSADQVAGGGGAQLGGAQTSGGQTGGVQIEDNYIAKTQSGLPIPVLFEKSHLTEVEKSNEDDHKFWKTQYGAARSSQTAQANILRKLENEETERQKDIHAFQTAPKELLTGPTKSAIDLHRQFKQQEAKLEEVNHAIFSRNRAAGRDATFGQVRTHSLVEPKLNNQDDFKSRVTPNSALQLLLAEPYYQASQLQHYHRSYMKATTEATHDKSIETRILGALVDINSQVEGYMLDQFKQGQAAKRENEEQELIQGGMLNKKKKKDLDRKYKSAQKKFEVACLVYVPNEGEDDYSLPDFEDSDEDSDLDDDSDAESLMSGVDDKPHVEKRGNGKDGQSEKEPLPKEVYEIRSRMGGREGPLFAYIDARLKGTEDNEAGEKLKSLAREVDEFCDAKNINRATYALTDTHIQAFTDMAKTAEESIQALKVNTNDANLINAYKLLRQRAELFIQEHQWPESFLDTFVPSEPEVLKLIAGETKEAAEKTQREQEAAQKAQQEKEAAQKAQQATEAPPAEDTDEQCIVSVSIPGVVAEMEDGMLRHKRVANIRKCGMGGHQLVLKSHGTNPVYKNRFIFELVPARSFAGALQEFKAMNPGKQIKTITRNDIKDQPWRRVLIGGVMSPRRKVGQLYKIRAVTLVNIKFPGSDFMWASQGVLKEEFGENDVQAKIDQYMVESGQKAPKAPTERVFRRSKKELAALKKQKEATTKEDGAQMTRTRKYKKKTPLKSAHPKSKTSFPDTDGEEEGDDVNDESERSEDEDDSGSMAEFLEDDDAVEYTAEDIANAKAQLKMMMKQRKR